MSDLPPEAAELLAQARAAHDPPDPEVAGRVRRRVAVIVAAAGADSADSTLTGHGDGFLAHLTVKFWGTALVIGAVVSGLVLTAIGYSRVSTPPRPARSVEVAQPTVETVATHLEGDGEAAVPHNAPPEPIVAPVQEPPQDLPPPPVVSKVRHVRPRSTPADTHTSVPQDTLAAEMRLLRQSSDALEARDPRRALQLLDQYRASFTRPALADEHEGLRIAARCALSDQMARADAKRLLAKTPTSVLRENLVRACSLREE